MVLWLKTKQDLARERNWKIKQLRAYFHLVPPPVSPHIRQRIQKLINAEIVKLGAESELLREKKRKERLEADED